MSHRVFARLAGTWTYLERAHVQVSLLKSGVGSWSLDLPVQDPKAPALEAEFMGSPVKVQVWKDGALLGPLSGYLEYLGKVRVAADGSAIQQYTGRTMASVLEDGAIPPRAVGSTNTSGIPSGFNTAGAYVIAVVNYLKSFGYLSYVDLLFSATTTTQGDPWAHVSQTQFEVGTNALAACDTLASSGQWEYEVYEGDDGRIKVAGYNVGFRGRDLSNSVLFIKGRDLGDTTDQLRYDGLGTSFGVYAGATGTGTILYHEETDQAALARWDGRKKLVIETRQDIFDLPTLVRFVQAKLPHVTTMVPQTEISSVTAVAGSATPEPLSDFTVGDYIGLLTDFGAGPAKRQVDQVTLDIQPGGVVVTYSGTVSLSFQDPRIPPPPAVSATGTSSRPPENPQPPTTGGPGDPPIDPTGGGNPTPSPAETPGDEGTIWTSHESKAQWLPPVIPPPGEANTPERFPLAQPDGRVSWSADIDTEGGARFGNFRREVGDPHGNTAVGSGAVYADRIETAYFSSDSARVRDFVELDYHSMLRFREYFSHREGPDIPVSDRWIAGVEYGGDGASGGPGAGTYLSQLQLVLDTADPAAGGAVDTSHPGYKLVDIVPLLSFLYKQWKAGGFTGGGGGGGTPPAAPGAVQSLTALPGVEEIAAAWTAPDGAAPTGYRATIDPPTTSGGVEALVSTNPDGSLSASWGGLVGGTTYHVTVVALNGSTASAPVTVDATPLVRAVPGPVTGLTGLGTSQPGPNNGSVALAWTAPDGDVSNYIVSYAHSGTGGAGGTEQIVPGTETSTTITTLEAGQSYTFSVVAENAAGSGPAVTVDVTP